MPRRLSSTHRDVVAEVVRLTTPSFPPLDDPARRRVHSRVTAFVTSQIEGLPSFMSLPYRAMLTAFRLLPVLRFGRDFRSLDETTKESYLAAWSDAKLGPCRDFIKLIRSCALLAFFDHPDVVRSLPAGASDAA